VSPGAEVCQSVSQVWAAHTDDRQTDRHEFHDRRREERKLTCGEGCRGGGVA